MMTNEMISTTTHGASQRLRAAAPVMSAVARRRSIADLATCTTGAYWATSNPAFGTKSHSQREHPT